MMTMMMDTNMHDILKLFVSLASTILLGRAMYEQYLPYPWRESIRSFLIRYTDKLVRIFSPYQDIIFEEYTGERFNRNQAYTTIETYLSEKTSVKARALKASFVKDGKALVFGLGDNEEVVDEFQGVKVWWKAHKHFSQSQMITIFPGADERRYYKLTFHNRHLKLITDSYLRHVVDEGKAIAIRKRQRKLYTNIKKKSDSDFSKSTLWSHVEFIHPATFETLAMEPTEKQAIINDLIRFSKAKDYYAKIGKPWKRGFLLYGPPGTGKSTMIAAIANLMEYDVYDLELTAVEDNTQLRSLIIETSNKAIIVIEEIDCSLQLTGQRSKTDKEKNDDKKEDEKEAIKKELKGEKDNKKSEVTLSGLLNIIDGIWSACGEEKLIIFTTNYFEKLDPALIRRGRMDVHIGLSYCCYEAFKVLARNYLDIESHPLFETIKRLLEESKVTPADVAESLMPKSIELNVQACLENLVCALEKAKEEEEKLKVKEERRKKEEVKDDEEEGKLKDEKNANSRVEENKENKPSSEEKEEKN